VTQVVVVPMCASDIDNKYLMAVDQFYKLIFNDDLLQQINKTTL